MNRKKNKKVLCQNAHLKTYCDQILELMCKDAYSYSEILNDYTNLINSRGIKEFFFVKRLAKKILK